MIMIRCVGTGAGDFVSYSFVYIIYLQLYFKKKFTCNYVLYTCLGLCLVFNIKFDRQKKVRFPKGKKVKAENVVVGKGNTEDDPADLKDPRLAAKERAKRRSQMTTELFCEESKGLNDVSAAEVTYEVYFQMHISFLNIVFLSWFWV